MEINIGMSRKGLRAFAREILTECEAHSLPQDEGIEITLSAAHNGSGPGLVLTFGNDDMERLETQGAAYWEEG